MQMDDIILRFEGVSKRFPGVQALDSVSFAVKRGSVHCIVGENGAGKSTLLKIIDGLYRKDEGEIIFNGKPWIPQGSAEAHRSGICMVHQELNIISEMAVFENMFLGRETMGKSRIFLNDRAMKKQAQEYLDEQGIAVNAGEKMKHLSIAEAQLIEIIKAVTVGAEIILMDEPSSSLTQKEVEFLFSKVAELKARGITIIYISHKLEEVFQIGDYISVFRDGRHIDTAPASTFTRDTVIEKMVGRKMDEVYPPRNAQIGEEAIRVERFSKAGVFSDISFSAAKGEILGISGLVGAGRSEIARAIIGLDAKDEGEVFCNGKKLKINNVNDAIAGGITMISEDRRRYGLVLQRSVRENSSLVALRHLFGLMVIPLKKETDAVRKMTERLSVKTPSLNTEVRTLSGGNQQKVVLAKWLSVSPKVLIMDEPTRGIDVGTKYEIYKLMNQMTEDGMCIIMINSDMEELLGMSDRILVIREGKVAGELNRMEATAQTIMHMAVGGKE